MDKKIKTILSRDFLSFARKAILDLEGTKIVKEPYLKYLAYELDQFANEETCRLIVNLPPGHLKTLLGSVSLVAWMLAHDPSLKIIIVSHAEHLSKAIARKIREIIQSVWFKELFTTRIKSGPCRGNGLRYDIRRRRLRDIISRPLHWASRRRHHRR